MSTQDTKLPPLPEADHRGPTGTGSYFDSYSADKMREYARAAIAAQAQPPGFSPMWLAPLDGTPVMLYMPTTTNKFAVGQWHGSHDSIIGNWGDDESNYFTHTPVSFMALSNLERIANPQAAVKESLTLEQVEAVADVDDAAYALLAILQRVGPGATVGQVLAILEQAQQAQGVPAGWRLAKVSDGDIRVYGPDKETWLIRSDCGEGLYEFIHRFFDALLATTPKSEQDK